MKKTLSFLSRLFAHTARHRELYYLPLVVIAVCVLGLYFVNWITGRPVADDPGVIVGYLYQAVGIAIVLALTGFTQQLFFGYRGDEPPKGDDGQPAGNVPIQDDIYDAVITLCVLCLYSSLVFSLWR